MNSTSSRLGAMLPMLLDIIIPVVGYFALHAAGLTDFLALTVAGSATAVYTVVNTVRRGRLDAVGTLVVLELALSVALLLITQDPRVVLMKPSFFTALAGLYLFYTCLAGRPFIYEASKPFVARRGPQYARAFDLAWTHSRAFRREARLITAGWGVLWLAEAVIRIPVVLNSSASQGVLTGQLPGVVAIVVGIVFTRLRIPKLRAHALRQLPAENPDQHTQRLPSVDLPRH